ncbi:MAG: hypothetical protein PHE54_03490 [Bacilli bacterium]|nr:hypothetical protein [Bacilli bacterium]
MKINNTSIFYIIVVLLCSLFFIYYTITSKYNDDLVWTKEYVIGEEGIKGEVDMTQFGTNEVYAIGANQYGYAVFKDPDAAFKQMKKEYSKAIQNIRDEFNLNMLSRLSYQDYMNYGWQLSGDYTEEEINDARTVSNFLDIYDNSID